MTAKPHLGTPKINKSPEESCTRQPGVYAKARVLTCRSTNLCSIANIFNNKRSRSMRRVSRLLFPVFICAFAVLNGQAQAARNVRVDFKETTLKNGLRVITVEDHSAPVIAVSVTYNVGSRNERQGRTGFAHLFEHMMFKGSENVGSGEHFMLVFNNGGNMNGTTNENRTNYFEILPANQLDSGLFLEPDRMQKSPI